jgi:hypothetical protein
MNQAIASIEKLVSHEIEELIKKNIYKSTLDPKITATMIIGGVLLVVYEYGKMKQDVLNTKLIETMAMNYLHGVLR